MFLSSSYTPKSVTYERMCEAIDVILSLQNPNGGFASYELIRGTKYMELINPAEVFVSWTWLLCAVEA